MDSHGGGRGTFRVSHGFETPIVLGIRYEGAKMSGVVPWNGRDQSYLGQARVVNFAFTSACDTIGRKVHNSKGSAKRLYQTKALQLPDSHQEDTSASQALSSPPGKEGLVSRILRIDREGPEKVSFISRPVEER
jgi:hypothetical protein